nr:hypothetical protein [Bacteroidota bacterium]
LSDGTSPTINHFQKVLHKKEQRLQDEMLVLAKRAEKQNYSTLFSEKPNYYNTLLEKEGLALLIYENDTLKFWSDNSIAVENWIKEVCLDTKMVKLHNGWFEVMHPNSNSTTTKTVVGLILIKNEYPYQNNYLVNEFRKDFDLPAETKLITDPPQADSNNAVKNYKYDYLFSLKFDTTTSSVSTLSYISVFLNIAGFLLFILFLKNITSLLQKRIGKNRSLILFIFLVGLFRYISIILSFPESFYNFNLFSPQVYADASSVWLSSLGDLLINVLLLFYLSYVVFTEYNFDNLFSRLKSLNKLAISLILFLCFFWFSWIITTLFTGLIKNSNISFGINNLFSLNQYSYIGIIIMGLLLFVYFLFADKMVSVLKLLGLSTKQYILVFLLSTAVHIFISHFLGTLDLVIIFWPFVLILFIAGIKKRQITYPFSAIILLVFLFSLYAVHIFIKHIKIKEKENRKVHIEKLAAEQDPIAELLFQDIEKELVSDSILVSYVKKPTEFEKRIKQQYFSGFWEKYVVRIALFDSMCVPIILSPNIAFDNNLYFDELITDKSVPTTCEHFNFLKNTSGKISYLAKLPLYKNYKARAKYGTLYIELDAKFISDEIGFPELLLDRNIGLSQELTNYSYAKYKHGQLINQYGKYSYNFTGSNFDLFANYYVFIDKEGYNHLLFRPDPETLIVLSKRSEGLIDKVTIFSYLFAFFSLLLLTILVLRQISLGRILENFSFKYRIQVL